MAAPLPPRRPLTKAQRVRVFDSQGGECHICCQPIRIGEKWEVDHIIARWKQGRDLADNYAPAHVRCHAIKSSAETTQRAKADAVRAKHIGAKPPAKAKIPQRPKPPRPIRDKLPLPPRQPMYE